MRTVIVILLLLIPVLVGAGVYLMCLKKPSGSPGPAGSPAPGASVLTVRDGMAGRRLPPPDPDGIEGDAPGAFDPGPGFDEGWDDDPRLTRLRDPDCSGEERRAVADDLRSCGYVIRDNGSGESDDPGLIAEGVVDPDTLLSSTGERAGASRPVSVFPDRRGGKDDLAWRRLSGGPGVGS